MAKINKRSDLGLPRLKRTHRLTIVFNDSERSVIAQYIKKYKISNRSKLMREAIISHMLIRLEQDHPTLF